MPTLRQLAEADLTELRRLLDEVKAIKSVQTCFTSHHIACTDARLEPFIIAAVNATPALLDRLDALEACLSNYVFCHGARNADEQKLEAKALSLLKD